MSSSAVVPACSPDRVILCVSEGRMWTLLGGASLRGLVSCVS